MREIEVWGKDWNTTGTVQKGCVFSSSSSSLIFFSVYVQFFFWQVSVSNWNWTNLIPCHALSAYWKGKGSVDFSRHLPTIPTFKTRNGQTPIMLSCTWLNYYFIFPLIQLLTWTPFPSLYFISQEERITMIKIQLGIWYLVFALWNFYYLKYLIYWIFFFKVKDRED